VERNLTTALVLEDDVDWDIRLKSQMQSFSLASRAFLTDLDGTEEYPQPESLTSKAKDTNVFEAPYSTSHTTPYGEDWDILWLGHVGADLPADYKTGGNKNHPPRSLSVVTIPDDDTVPSPNHLKPHPFADAPDHFSELYPAHSRLVHESRETIGAQGYAVSQRGARRLLWQFGVDSFTNGWDILMRDFCDGLYSGDKVEGTRPVCLTVQPPLVSHHYARGGESDIHGVGGGYMKKYGSPYIRHSVKLNMGTLVATGSLAPDEQARVKDQWPDDGKGSW